MTNDFTKDPNVYYGLDVHQGTISIARIFPEESPQYVTTISNNPKDIEAFFKQELTQYAKIQTTYEAGGCGYHIHHQLTAMGIDNLVAAPSLIPKKPGKRVKNDKVDACNLAEYLRFGQLVGVHVPHEEQEAFKDLTRQRDAFKKQLRVARQQVQGMLRRYGKRYTDGKISWTMCYWNWLRKVKMPDLGRQEVLMEYIDNVEAIGDRIQKINQRITTLRAQWRKDSIAKALATLRGIDLFTATSIVAEVDDFSRFETAGQFMSYLGLTPGEFSSGERVGRNRVISAKVNRGSITKAGNKRLRWLLVEAAWHYRYLPSKPKALRTRWEGQPRQVLDHAWKAQARLYKKYTILNRKGKTSKVANIAVARELAGFIWSIGLMAETTLASGPQQPIKVA